MSDDTRTLIPETCEEAVRRWDAGESIFTVEMGGMGPGYEQCIHIMGMDIVRAFAGKTDDWDWEDAKTIGTKFEAAAAESARRLGVSGAQHGAAMSLAAMYLRNGWRKGLEMAPKDRHIQVNKDFPA